MKNYRVALAATRCLSVFMQLAMFVIIAFVIAFVFHSIFGFHHAEKPRQTPCDNGHCCPWSVDVDIPGFQVDINAEAGVVLPVIEERPTVNVPKDDRQQNWLGNEHEGSCVHASIISIMRWQGLYSTAEWWKNYHGNGEWPENMERQLNEAGLRYAENTTGDVAFLEWACSTRRGCGITVMGGAHMVTLVHLDAEWAAVLDNNSVDEFIWIPRDNLIREWKSSHGWAITVVYTPAAPLPH